TPVSDSGRGMSSSMGMTWRPPPPRDRAVADPHDPIVFQAWPSGDPAHRRPGRVLRDVVLLLPFPKNCRPLLPTSPENKGKSGAHPFDHRSGSSRCLLLPASHLRRRESRKVLRAGNVVRTGEEVLSALSRRLGPASHGTPAKGDGTPVEGIGLVFRQHPPYRSGQHCGQGWANDGPCRRSLGDHAMTTLLCRAALYVHAAHRRWGPAGLVLGLLLVLMLAPAHASPGGFGSCGDGHVDPGEQCDDGNHDSGDCCSPQCTF